MQTVSSSEQQLETYRQARRSVHAGGRVGGRVLQDELANEAPHIPLIPLSTGRLKIAQSFAMIFCSTTRAQFFRSQTAGAVKKTHSSHLCGIRHYRLLYYRIWYKCGVL